MLTALNTTKYVNILIDSPYLFILEQKPSVKHLPEDNQGLNILKCLSKLGLCRKVSGRHLCYE